MVTTDMLSSLSKNEKKKKNYLKIHFWANPPPTTYHFPLFMYIIIVHVKCINPDSITLSKM